MSKTGFKTTEFWLTLFKMLVGPALVVLVAAGTFTPDSVSEDKVVGYIEQISGGLMGLVALYMSGRAVRTYTEARTGVKLQEAQVAAQIGETADVVGFSVEEDEDEDEEDEDLGGFPAGYASRC